MLEPRANVLGCDFLLLGVSFHTGLSRNASREEGNTQITLKWIQELRGFLLRADSEHMIPYGINKISSAAAHYKQEFFACHVVAMLCY